MYLQLLKVCFCLSLRILYTVPDILNSNNTNMYDDNTSLIIWSITFQKSKIVSGTIIHFRKSMRCAQWMRVWVAIITLFTALQCGYIPSLRHNTRLRTKVKLLPHLHLIMFILRDVFIQLHNQFVLVGKWDKQTFRSPRECFMRRWGHRDRFMLFFSSLAIRF